MYGWLQNKQISLASPLDWPGKDWYSPACVYLIWDELHFTHTFDNNGLVNFHITYSAEEFLIKYAWVLFSPGFRTEIALMSRVYLFCDKLVVMYMSMVTWYQESRGDKVNTRGHSRAEKASKKTESTWVGLRHSWELLLRYTKQTIEQGKYLLINVQIMVSE